ncbi:hypothetical protein KUCAC02_033096 [Chaenocephalus aceratus]|nr:hypothetical protein KUCAC02_033096 [Chaenocephalus aceratus]
MRVHRKPETAAVPRRERFRETQIREEQSLSLSQCQGGYERILRSDWIQERKDRDETNNELKLGWAQGFYDWKCVPKDGTGRFFSHDAHCAKTGEMFAHSYGAVTHMLYKMSWCGFTPWSAVQAVRCAEAHILKITCDVCKTRLLASCVFLVESAAVEASRARDWLVRNEAVIQLCWLLYQIDKPPGVRGEELTEAWADSILTHSVKFQGYTTEKTLPGVEALVVLFANDHLPLVSQPASRTELPDADDNGAVEDPDPRLLDSIMRNERFSPERKPVIYPTATGEDFGISTTLDVLTEAPGAMEARAQEVPVIARALVSCFPRVAVDALEELTLKAPNTCKFAHNTWPVFVNSTRACYQLFKALALPVSPSPVYVLEMLARGWRHVAREVLEKSIPMGTGGIVKVSCRHYTKHILGPVNVLAHLGLIDASEKNLVIAALDKGVLPCFAGPGDSAPDQLVSSTVALVFAASGLRVFGFQAEERGGAQGTCVFNAGEKGCEQTTVTYAGLLYFAAWYVLVYTCALHAQPLLKEQLSRTGSDADKHLCAALELKRGTGDPELHEILDYDGGQIAQALRIVFRDLLDIDTTVRVAQLYVPELLAQLPYAKKLNRIPGSVKSAIESRDAWFAEEHGDGSRLERYEPPFAYLGSLAHGLHSSIRGTLVRSHARPIARAPRRPGCEFDPWCDSLMFSGPEEDHGSVSLEETLRGSIEDETVETYLQLDDEEEEEEEEEGDVLGTEPSPESRGGEALSTLEDRLGTLSLHERKVGELSGETVPGPRPSSEETEGINPRRICKGLLVEDPGKLGFRTGHRFLTMAPSNRVLENKQRVPSPVVGTPCMADIASTVYTKIRETESCETTPWREPTGAVGSLRAPED